MIHKRILPVLAAGAMMGFLGFAGPTASAQDTRDAKPDVAGVTTFVEQAGISLVDAIKKAEKECNGKAIHAAVLCDHDHSGDALIRDARDDDKGLGKPEHYKVCCLAGGKIIEVCVDSRNGTVLALHTTTALPAGIRVASQDAPRGDKFPPSEGSTRYAFRIQKASDLIGKSVENNRGEKLGEVQDLAIDPDRNGRVVYAVLSFGGFLGMGDKWFAIPMGALTLPDHARHFVLAVEKDRLKTAAGFDKERWPKMADTTWATGIHEFYGQRPYWVEDGESSASAVPLRIEKASDLMGRTVQNDRAEKLGKIEDLVIDPDQGRIVYGVLSFGGFLGVGDKLFAIPASSLQIPGTGAVVVLKVDKDQLKNATGFDKDHWPNLADPQFLTSTYEFYGQRPYDTRRNGK